MNSTEVFERKEEAAVIRAIDAIADESIAFLQTLIQIPTVNPPGDEYRAGAELIGKKTEGVRI